MRLSATGFRSIIGDICTSGPASYPDAQPLSTGALELCRREAVVKGGSGQGR